MLLRHTLPITLVALALACEPTVPHCDSPGSTDPACKGSFNPASVDIAAFDIASAPPDIPLPNDLALLEQAVVTQSGAQRELLRAFQQAGGFPNDQEVPITIDFVHQTIDPGTGKQTPSAPDLDLASINPPGAQPNVVVLSYSSNGVGGQIPIEQPTAADYLKGTDRGTLTLHKTIDRKADPKNTKRRWSPGQYVVAVRGGKSGVQVTGSTAGVSPSPAMFLLLQGKNLTLPENLTLIPGNSAAEKATNAAQLEQLRAGYLLPLSAVNGVFPQSEIAVLGTFRIAPAATHLETDPGAGLIPLPSDFLLDPANGGKTVINNPAFGPLAPGLATLDGFSTTAMILSQTSGPVDASTVNSGTVFLYELNLQSSPPTATRLAELREIAAGKTPRFVAEPPAITQTVGSASVSTVIGLQPAIPVQLPLALGGKFLPLPPLKEGTEYAVIITDGVKDFPNGAPLVKSTLAKLLLFTSPLFANGRSAVAGVSDAQAPALEQIRQVLQLPVGALAAEKGITKDHIAIAYTFRTQTITAIATQLGALPYNPAFPPALAAALAGPVPGRTLSFCTSPTATGATCTGFGPNSGTPDVKSVWNRYGLDPAVIPNGNIGGIIESVIVTPEILDPKTGAFTNPPVPTPVPIRVLISVPKVPVPVPVPAPGLPGPGCTPTATAPCAAPLVIFRHGVFGSRAAMLAVANELANNGMVVAAIDAAKQGDRSFCSASSQCVTGATCLQPASLAGQGDSPGATPGTCSGPASVLIDPANNGSFYRNKPFCDPTSTSCSGAFYVFNAGTPAVSGNFLISGNLFRTRDTFRQDIIDQSQLVHVLGLDPTHPPPAAQPQDSIFYSLAGNFGVVIDPTRIYFLGQSLGAIQGTVDVAANPRIGKAVLNVGGGTIADVFTNSPSLTPALIALLGTLNPPIKPGTSDFLQFVNVAKWVFDPADPINFAQHLTADPLQNLLPPLGGNPDGSVKQAAKKILGQVANCDETVPNPFNLLLYGLAGLGPESASKATQTVFIYPGNSGATPLAPCAIPASAGGGPVPHAFLTSWGAPKPPAGAPATYQADIATLTRAAQNDAARFLYLDEHPAPAEQP